MLTIRPIEESDYDSLLAIASESGIGFTSLPVNEALLRKKIEISQQAFSKDVLEPGNESYLFVMEDTDTNEVVGTSGIEASVGLNDAFYHYHLGKVVHASRELGIHNTSEILTFCNDYTGVSEICTLFLREKARGKSSAGRLLSKFRFLFMKQHAERFDEVVIAEMRGVSDEKGRSPFWEWLEKHFFSMDFPTADYLTGIGNKVFIAELMPKYPIYVKLLSKSAQKSIGQVHEHTKPALKLLKQEGFKCRGYVDIFDAGPTMEAEVDSITTVRNSHCLPVKICHKSGNKLAEHLLINTKVSDFRACIGEINFDSKGEASISYEVAKALKIEDGDSIRFSPIINNR